MLITVIFNPPKDIFFRLYNKMKTMLISEIIAILIPCSVFGYVVYNYFFYNEK